MHEGPTPPASRPSKFADSIVGRLVRALAWFAVVAILVVVPSIYWYSSIVVADEMDRQAQQIIRSIRHAAATVDSDKDFRAYIHELAADPGIAQIAVTLGQEQTIFAGGRKDWEGQPLASLPASETIADIARAARDRTSISGRHAQADELGRTEFVKGLFDGRDGVVAVQLDSAPVFWQSLEAAGITLFLSIVLNAFVISVVGLIAQRGVQDPARAIVSRIRRFEAGGALETTPLSAPAELREIATALNRSIAQKVEAQRINTESFEHSKALLEALRDAQSLFISNADPKKVFERLLVDLLMVTKSEYGFIAELETNKSGKRILKTRAVTDISWNAESNEMYQRGRETGLVFSNFDTLFGAAIKTQEPVIANDPANDPRRGGLPAGHPPLDAFLGLPISAAGEVVGMIAIANREGGYDQAIVNLLEPFLITCGNLMLAARAEIARRTTEATLRENEQQFRTLFALAPVGIALNRLEDGQYLMGSKAIYEMLGYTEQEFVNLTYWDITPRDYDADEARQLESLRTNGRYGPYEKHYIRKDGERLPVLLNGTLIKDSTGQDLILSIIQDISVQRATQDALAAARDAAEAANKAKSAFLATISHEIRTPMNGVLGMLGLLINAGLTPKQLEYANTALSCGQGLMHLINEILDFSKVEAGKLELEHIPFAPRSIIAETAAILKPEAEGKGLALDVRCADAVPNSVVGDPTRVRQILFNLAANAIKFTEQGGVTISLAHDANGAGPGATNLKIEVADTGIGISEQQRARLFQRFSQADGSITRKYGGTGLGLAICQQLANAMGGAITVDSDVGKGSRFLVTLPVRVPKETEQEQAQTRNAPAASPAPAVETPIAATPVAAPHKIEPATAAEAPLRILVAEDHPVNQKLMRVFLDPLGHTVDVVANGAEALAAVKQMPYDVVLMDVQMPEMDGMTATREIRKLPGDVARIPIIALTANAMTGDRENYLAAGADDYVSKPVNMADLYAAIDRVVPREKRGKRTRAATG